MKKLVLGLIATVMFGFAGNAQTKVSKEEARIQFATSMSELVSQAAPSYKRGMTYENFTQVILGGNSNSTIPTKEGQNLLKTTFNFLSKGTSSKEIIKSYNGVEMAAASSIIIKAETLNQGITDVFGENILSENLITSKWCWSCIVLWIWDHREEIKEVLCWFGVGC